MIKTTLYLILYSLLFGCASRGMPGGGPRDTTAPRVIATHPAASSVNVDGIKDFHIRFSEDMNESSAVNKIYISPPLKIKMSWSSADELVLSADEKLRSNQTYVITLGRDLSDLRGNKMAASFQLAFSTGPKIDTGSVSGRVFDLNKNKSIAVFAYPVSGQGSVLLDTTARYISQSGTNGSFRINFMGFGVYRFFAVDDQNNNHKIDAAFESVGIPARDVSIDSLTPSYDGLNFRLTHIDTTAPRITRLQAVSDIKIKAYLSEEVFHGHDMDISVSDSISKQRKKIILLAEDPKDNNILDIFTEPLDSSRVYRLTATALTDSSGNHGPATTQFFRARGRTSADSLKLLKFLPADSSMNNSPWTQLRFYFSTPLKTDALNNRLILKSEKGDTVSGRVSRQSESTFGFLPRRRLGFDTWYTFSLKLSGLEDVFGQLFPDSLLQGAFKTKSTDAYGSMSGTVWADTSIHGPLQLTVHALQGVYTQQVKASKDRSFSFPYLPAGSYRLSAFADVDSNQVYSMGNLFPFKFSEPFVFIPDTVKIRKRWETTDVQVDFSRSK